VAIIKSLSILLRGDTSKLKSDFSNGKTAVSKFGSQVSSILRSAIPVLSVGGFLASIKQASAELDVIGKRAVKLSIDTGELISLERVAKLAGASMSDVETGVRNLNRTISDSMAGNRMATDSLSRLGLSASQLDKLTTTEQFTKISGGLAKIESRADRTALAMKLFGRSGVNLIPLLSDTETLQESFEKTRKLGGLFTSSQIKQVEAQNDSFADFVFTAKNIMRAISIDMAPAFKMLYDSITDAIKPGTFFNGLMKGIGEVAHLVTLPLNILAFTIKGLSEFMGGAVGRIVGYAVAFAIVARVTKTLITISKAFRAVQLSLLAIETARAALTLKGVAKTAAAATVFAGVILAVNQLEASIGGVFKEAAKAGDEMEALADASDKIKKIDINTQSAGRGTQEAFATIFRATAEVPMEKLIDITKDGNAVLDEINDKLGRANNLNLELGGDVL
jgi:hypothetical protein